MDPRDISTRTVELLADLPGLNAILYMGLGDEKRRAVCLVATFDGPSTQGPEVQTTTGIDPAYGSLIAHEDFIGTELGYRDDR